MKKVVLCLFIMLLAVNVWADDFSFRGINWTTSKDEILKLEKGKLAKDNGWMLFFDVGKVLNMQTESVYMFTTNGDLAGCGYIFKPEHINNNDYLSDYENVKKSVSSKYGEPKTNEEKWDTKASKDMMEKEYKGLALTMGSLELSTVWQLDEFIIYLFGETSESEVEIMLSYENIAMADALNKDIEERGKAEAEELF